MKKIGTGKVLGEIDPKTGKTKASKKRKGDVHDTSREPKKAS